MENKCGEYSLSTNKMTALIYMYLIYFRESDADHPINRDEMVKRLAEDYGVTLEKKTVGRYIRVLIEAGVKLVVNGAGTYMDERIFEESELRVLIDSVLSSKYITENYSKDLINKLIGLSNVYFKSHIKNIYNMADWSKTDNKTFFYSIDRIDEAIEKERQIEFDYNKYGIDKKLHKSTHAVVSPYQFILRNQCYYLMAYNEKWGNIIFYRVDHITNIVVKKADRTELRNVPGYENGIDYKRIAQVPYMYSDEAKRVELAVDKGIINQVVEWFGHDVEIYEEDDYLRVVVVSSLKAMEYWCMQYMNYVTVLKPQVLVDTIKHNLQKAIQKYK